MKKVGVYKRTLIKRLCKDKVIGGKHLAKDTFLRHYKRLPEFPQFKQAYKELVKEKAIIERNKRTGKGSGAQVCLSSNIEDYKHYLPR